MAINFSLACRQIRYELGKHFAFINNTFGAILAKGIVPELAELKVGQKNSIEVFISDYVNPHGIEDEYYQSVFKELQNLKRLVLRDLVAMTDQEKDITLKSLQEACTDKEMRIEILNIC
ncbi:hypothetical protein G6011_07573 [Alternaria panax]|uniref:Uncharacterized protein n=1 Tax=Alternaria panax TaxID=48097 RepID=A0AAD4FH47_9PLEO|nr:hypothetical protein G6011_07573 [Alternaria panax]